MTLAPSQQKTRQTYECSRNEPIPSPQRKPKDGHRNYDKSNNHHVIEGRKQNFRIRDSAKRPGYVVIEVIKPCQDEAHLESNEEGP